MCIKPNMLPDGTEVACRKCKQCKRQIINDWAGRIIAETKTTKVTYYVTLTYGRDEHGEQDHIRAAVLTYSDVQKYLKRIRDAYGKFRYFVVGEYGEEKGRAHWHVILFAEKEMPGVELNNIFYTDKKWTHGTSLWKKFQPHHAYYCCKYVFKDYRDDLKIAKYSMSKKPPLGDAYFKTVAKRYVDQGLAPQTVMYTFREVVEKNGKERKFRMRAKTLENFCREYVTQWRKKTPWKHTPRSPVIDEYLDKIAAKENEIDEMNDLLGASAEAAYNARELEEEIGPLPKDARSVSTQYYEWGVAPEYYQYKRYPGDKKKVNPKIYRNPTPKADKEPPLP